MHFMGRLLVSAICVIGAAQTIAAQETINYASVSGRVTDPQGAVVPGAQVTRAQTETNLTREAVTDQEGRFRFPYLRVGPTRSSCGLPGFADADATADADGRLGVRAARSRSRWPGSTRASTVTGEATVLEAARSQIAGTVSQAEVQDLPMNGRNFLDLALLVPGVSPTNIGSTQLFAETSAVPGSGPLGRQPAQLLQQLHRRRPVGQRRCGRAERHSVRRRCRRAVSGRHVRRAGRARARARRLHQRRDQERHQRAARRRLRLLPRRQLQRRQRAVGHEAADEPEAVRRRASAARSRATGRSTSRTSSSAGSTRPGW